MPDPAPGPAIVDNAAASRFEVHVEGEVAVLEYVRDGQRAVYHTTRVPKTLEGRGIAGQLAKHALDDARARGLRVVAECSFVAGYVSRHPEYADLVTEDDAPT